MYSERIILLLCTAVFMCKHVPAQQPYFQEENFPSPLTEIKHVTGIAADKNNCIWFATQTGVYRYDGTRFRHYSVLNTPVLKFERMANMVLRRSKGADNWCLADTKGILYEVDSLSRLRPFLARPGSREQIIYEKYGYHILNPKKHKINLSLQDSIFETYIIPSSNKVFLLLLNGDIVSMTTSDFLNGGKGIILYSLKNNFSYREHYGTKTLATNNYFYLITPDSLVRWENHSVQPQRVILSGDILANNTKRINYDSLVILKTSNPGLILFWYNGNIYEAVESRHNKILDTRLLIKGNDKELPVSVFYSPAQQLFISYYLNKGLIFYRPRQFSLLTGSTANASSNFADYCYSMIRADNGFITVNNSGIVWLGINGETRLLNREPCYKYFISEDRSGNVWYGGKRNESICYLEAGTGKPVQVLKSGLNNVLIGMHQFDDTTYYLLTNRVLKKIVLKEGIVTSTKNLYTAPPGIEYNVLYAPDSLTLWLGADRGLIEFSIADNAIKKVAALDSVYVRSMIKLSENNYLLGTYDKGIYQLSDGKWKQLSSLEKDMPASAHAFIVDRSTSSLWVSSNEGILRLSLNQLLNNTDQKSNITFGHFTNFEPGISPEFNGSSNVSGARLSDTCLAFANANGLVVFNPLKLISYPLPVNVLIESLPGNNNDSLSKMEISSNHIEFNPVVPYFGNRDDLEVLYHLTNSDDEWHKLSPNTTISYNNLKPGDHDLQFRIRHYHDAGEKNVFLTAKSFSVPYRWYEKPWFTIAAGAFFLLLFVSFHYLRTWYLMKRRKELEQLVKRKTSELQETNENLVNVINELSISEASLKQSNFLKDEYYAVLTHDLRSPLKFLSFNISQLLEFSPELKHEGLKKGLFTAYQCSTDVYKLIDEFVYWIQDNEKQLKTQPSATMISAVIEDAKKIYGFSLEGNKNTFITDVPPDLTFTTDPKLLFIILRNAIDNANKYTSGGTITVSANRQNGNLQITVADTGRGISEDKVQQLIDLQNGNVQLSYKQRKSLGFFIMAMLTKTLGGRYTISSNKENGTSLCFTIPELKEEQN